MTSGDASEVVHRVLTFVMKCLRISQGGGGISELTVCFHFLFLEGKLQWNKGLGSCRGAAWPVLSAPQAHQGPPVTIAFCMHESGPDISPEVSCILIAFHLPYACSICPSCRPGRPLIPPSSAFHFCVKQSPLLAEDVNYLNSVRVSFSTILLFRNKT